MNSMVMKMDSRMTEEDEDEDEAVDEFLMNNGAKANIMNELLRLVPLTFRKNNPPAGKIIRCTPGSTLSGSPSLYHVIVGEGTPSALQFNVTGS